MRQNRRQKTNSYIGLNRIIEPTRLFLENAMKEKKVIYQIYGGICYGDVMGSNVIGDLHNFLYSSGLECITVAHYIDVG